MPELTFQIQGVDPALSSAAPQLNLRILIKSADPEALIQNILLQCQIQIEPARRRYEPAEQKGLRDLFGEPERWGKTLKPMLWTNTSGIIPPFTGQTVAEVPLPCTFDFTVAATKYFHGLKSGEIPICTLFSGTVFYAAQDAAWQVDRISWNCEASYRIPVSTWKEMMDRHYPNTAWLCLRRDVFDQLHEYKVSHGIPTWEQAFENMLSIVEEGDLRSPLLKVHS
jgi:Family of unknown function (DUF6084)